MSYTLPAQPPRESKGQRKARRKREKAVEAEARAKKAEETALEFKATYEGELPALEEAHAEAERVLAPFIATLDAAKAEMKKWDRREASPLHGRYAAVARLLQVGPTRGCQAAREARRA